MWHYNFNGNVGIFEILFEPMEPFINLLKREFYQIFWDSAGFIGILRDFMAGLIDF